MRYGLPKPPQEMTNAELEEFIEKMPVGIVGCFRMREYIIELLARKKRIKHD